MLQKAKNGFGGAIEDHVTIFRLPWLYAAYITFKTEEYAEFMQEISFRFAIG